MSEYLTPFEEAAERCDRIVAAIATASELVNKDTAVAEMALTLFCLTTEAAEA
jgi:hypothetical protein|tara:strand:- start:1440 stop:1598 length:159 start_codon:yes stop_codon:yes gene_type:complete